MKLQKFNSKHTMSKIMFLYFSLLIRRPDVQPPDVGPLDEATNFVGTKPYFLSRAPSSTVAVRYVVISTHLSATRCRY